LLARTDTQTLRYQNSDNDPRGPWASDNYASNKSKDERPTLWYSIKHPKTGEEVWPDESAVWRYTKTKHEQLELEGRLYWGPDQSYKKPRFKRFLSEIQNGVVPSTWWKFDDCGHNDEAKKENKALLLNETFSTPKPERLLKRIIEIATAENDLVLDFHLGSGTTAAVAHKMGRRYIGVEQMDYIETITVERLKKVIGRKVQPKDKLIEELEYDTGGVSKAVNWQGGGSFVYCELNRANQTFIDQIQAAKTAEELQIIWQAMQERAFLSYKINPKTIDANKGEFEALTFEERQRFLVEVLDKNMLYVPYSEIDDVTYNVSAEDKALNKQFFKLGEGTRS
jgi:adenine-specific DNA-methyltransferase